MEQGNSSVSVIAQKFLGFIITGKWKEAASMCFIKDPKELANFIQGCTSSIGKFEHWESLVITSHNQAYAVATYRKCDFQWVLAIDPSGQPAIVGLDAKLAGEFRKPEEDEQELVQEFQGGSGQWKEVTLGQTPAAVAAPVTAVLVDDRPAPVGIPNRLYPNAKRIEIPTAAGFVNLLVTKKFGEAGKQSVLKTTAGAQGYYEGAVGPLGAFKRFMEATVVDNGTVYLCAEHEHGILEWIVAVNRSGSPPAICGLDSRHAGALRLPTENGQCILDTVAASADETPNPEWWKLIVPKKRAVRLDWKYAISKNDFHPDGYLTLLLPPDRPYQKHAALRVSPEPNELVRQRTEGNSFARCKWEKRPSSISVSLDLLFDPAPHNPGTFIQDVSQDQPARYLARTTHTSAVIDSDHPKVRPIVARIVGNETNPLKKVELIAKHVANIPYEMPPAGKGWPTLDEYLSNYRYVECGGHALLFVLFCRAVGIPARRLFWPFISSEAGNLKIGSHEIAEFYHPDYSWIAVDATSGPFDVTNRHMWGCTPMTGSVPRAICLHAESQSGIETKAFNHVRYKSLTDAVVTLLPSP